jgi:hypothetical protein
LGIQRELLSAEVRLDKDFNLWGVQMTYFDCLIAGAWMFAIGWFLGATYVQNQKKKTEKTQSPSAIEKSVPSESVEQCNEREAWRAVEIGTAGAAD